MTKEQEKAILDRLVAEDLPKRFANYAFRVVPNLGLDPQRSFLLERDWVGSKRPTNSQVQLCYTAINSYVEGYLACAEFCLKG